MVYISLILSSLTATAFSESFINPPTSGANQDFSQNPTWLLNSVQNLTWVTTLSNYNITLWQQSLYEAAAGIVGTIYVKNDGNTEIGRNGFSWTVTTYQGSLSDSNIFFMLLGHGSLGGDQNGQFSSNYINFTTNAALVPTTTTTATSASSTSLLSTSSPSSSPTSTSGSSPSTTSTASPSPGGISSSTRIGLGLGLGLGIPLLFAIAFFAAWKIITSRRNNAQGRLYPTSPALVHSNPHEVHEMGGNEVVELPERWSYQQGKPKPNAVTS